MFSNFNPAARRVLRVAEQECRNHSHYYVGAEHLLVALLEERDPATLQALDADGIDAAEVHAEVRRALGTGEDRLWEGILITPRVRRIIALAQEHAGDREIGPIDLFEALANRRRQLRGRDSAPRRDPKHRLRARVKKPVEHLQQAIVSLIDTYGYVGLFVALALGNMGVPVGTEVILPVAGGLTATGPSEQPLADDRRRDGGRAGRRIRSAMRSGASAACRSSSATESTCTSRTIA